MAYVGQAGWRSWLAGGTGKGNGNGKGKVGRGWRVVARLATNFPKVSYNFSAIVSKVTYKKSVLQGEVTHKKSGKSSQVTK